jgi:hypothetical protein
MGRARRTIVPAATDGGPRVRFEKLETLLRVALDMRGNAEGLSLADIEQDYGHGQLVWNGWAIGSNSPNVSRWVELFNQKFFK